MTERWKKDKTKMKEQTRRRSSRNSKQNAESTPSHTGRSRSASVNENISHRRSTKTTTPVNVQPAQRKRKRSVSSVERPKIPKKIVDGRVIDQYCWVCHKFGYESTCETCPRVYHKNCLKKVKGSSNQPLSCECCMKRVDGKSEDLDLNKDQLQKLLQCVMQEAIKEGKKNNQKSRKSESNSFCSRFQTWPIENDTLCKIMDLDILIDCMNGETGYSSTGEFFLDVKWIYHNCCISYGSDNEMAETALKMEKNFKLELTDAEACTDCYRNKYLYADSFTKVCRNDHKIIWAKLRGSPYWPAKLLNMHNGHADVRFFGTHDKANILSKNCFEISKHAPLKKKIKQLKYQEAMDELLIYIRNYHNDKGHFTYFEVNTPLKDDDAHAKKPLHQRGQNKVNNAEQVSRNKSSSGNSESENACDPGSDIEEGTQEEQDSLTRSTGSGTSEDINEHPFPNDTEVKCIRKFVDNGNQNTESIEGRSADGTSIVYHTIFSADTHNGPASDSNNADEIMDSSSYNTSSNSLNPSDNSSSLLYERYKNLLCQANLNCASEDDSEEIEIIGEESKQSPVYNNFSRNPAILRALIEILFGNKPRIKEQFHKFNILIMHSLLSLWVEMLNFDKADIKIFGEVCNRYVKAIDYEKLMNVDLRKIITAQDDELRKLRAALNILQNEKHSPQDCIVKTTEQRIEHKNWTKEIRRLKEREAKLKNDKQRWAKEKAFLHTQLKQAAQKIKMRDMKISELRNEVYEANSRRIQQNLENMCSISSQTEETHHDYSEKEFHNPDCAPVILQKQDSAQLIRDNHENSTEAAKSQQVQDFPHTDIQVPNPVSSPQVPHSDSSSKYQKTISKSRSKAIRNIETKTSGKRKKNNT